MVEDEAMPEIKGSVAEEPISVQQRSLTLLDVQTLLSMRVELEDWI